MSWDINLTSSSTSTTSSVQSSFSSTELRSKYVSFCALQLEVDDAHSDLKHLEYNRGKSLEDLFEGLTILPPRSHVEGVKSARRARGKRNMGEVKVTTTLFKEVEDKGCSDKESTPVSEKGETSKSSTKESTPALSYSSSAATASSIDNDHIKFISGNPFVEVTKGVLHLYKENQTTSLDEGVIRSPMICMLGVPAKIKSPDLLQFTAPCHSQLEMMRIIQDGSPNQYMVLLRFRCQEAADEFYTAFNGQRFNSFETDVCSLVYVSKVETCKESEYYPMAGHTELPVCSICLERMDESVSTVLTILCNHTFHGFCLGQWEDSTCPVCRYVQTPEVVAEQRCSDCQSAEDLWICLVCGYVGCGRYVGGHSHAHFAQTQHCYTMELGQNRVWDYVGDNFVHRLLQTDSADGKLVETGGGSGGGSGGADGECKDHKSVVDGVPVNTDEKLDSIQLEYTYLLTSQLEAQRRYYEEKLCRLEDNANREMEEVTNRARTSVEESKEMESRLTALMKEKAKLEQKASQQNAKISKLTAELKEEKQLNKSLCQNQSEWQSKWDQLVDKVERDKAENAKQIGDLQEQIRDLMFYLEAQQTIAKSPLSDELKDGEVSVGEAAKTSKHRRKRGGK